MTTTAAPSPELIFGTIQSYQRSFALKAGVDLDLFTAIGEGAATVPVIAGRIAASERGVRILCDFLTISGLLTKSGDRYQLTPDAAAFLDKRSPAYMGSMTEFLLAPDIMRNFADLAATVKRGTVAPQARSP